MEVYSAHNAELAENFEGNKEKVREFLDIESKPIRNKIAGYLTKYVKRKRKNE